jgi:hypothetical protein
VDETDGILALSQLLLTFSRAGYLGRKLLYEVLLPSPLAFSAGCEYDPMVSPTIFHFKTAFVTAAEEQCPEASEALLSVLLVLFSSTSPRLGSGAQAASSSSSLPLRPAIAASSLPSHASHGSSAALSDPSLDAGSDEAEQMHAELNALDGSDLSDSIAGQEGTGEALQHWSDGALSGEEMMLRTRIKHLLVDCKIAVDVVDMVLIMCQSAHAKYLTTLAYTFLHHLVEFDLDANGAHATVAGMLVHNRVFVKELLQLCTAFGFDRDEAACKLLARLLQQSPWAASTIVAASNGLDGSHSLRYMLQSFMENQKVQCQQCGASVQSWYECTHCDVNRAHRFVCQNCWTSNDDDLAKHKGVHQFRIVLPFNAQQNLEEPLSGQPSSSSSCAGSPERVRPIGRGSILRHCGACRGLPHALHQSTLASGPAAVHLQYVVCGAAVIPAASMDSGSDVRPADVECSTALCLLPRSQAC